eukprot:GFYU01013010.1.p1 GENE.GFYU01013010.1~~GFYU01013010.1.p1  ORF type:complete len:259 (+),score=11.67 GFYU01013010.1:72-848(+)
MVGVFISGHTGQSLVEAKPASVVYGLSLIVLTLTILLKDVIVHGPEWHGTHEASNIGKDNLPQQCGALATPDSTSTTTASVKVSKNSGEEFRVNVKNAHKPFLIAATNGKLQILEMLTEQVGTVDTPQINKRTALFFACQNGHTDVVDYLVGKGADVNAVDIDGVTPLHLCAEKGHPLVVQTLIASGAQIDATTKDGLTPLHLAAGYGRLEVARILMENGSDPSVPDERQVTAMEWAKQRGNHEIAEVIVEMSTTTTT